MDREEITERIETRRNRSADDEVTLSRTHDISFGQGFMGELRVEYKPEEFRLTESGFNALATAGFFSPTFEELDHEPVVEALIADLYHALVDVLFPKHAYLDEPWQTLPLVVEVRYGQDGSPSEYFASIGSYR